MDHDEPRLSKRGPAALLALLLSILLSPAGAATALADVGPVSVTQPQGGKSVVLSRTLRRTSDDQADPSDPTFDSGGIPSSAAVQLGRHAKSAGSRSRTSSLLAGDRPAPFRARAPPAA